MANHRKPKQKAPYEFKGYSQYGAQRGRRNTPPEQFNFDEPLRLRRVPPSDSGGDYDPGGAYWGDIRSKPLYCAFDCDGNAFYMRTSSPAAVQAKFPKEARWYRGSR